MPKVLLAPPAGFFYTSSSRFHRQGHVLLALLICALLGCSSAPSSSVREALAPTGTLRIAVYPGSPTSLVEKAPVDDMRGLTVDIGRELARELGVKAEIMVFQRLAEALAALQAGQADFTITNATEQRKQLVDFAPPLVDLELGVLVHSNSRITSMDGFDQPAAIVGVAKGSSSERVLGEKFTQTRIVAFPNLQAARKALQAEEIDGFATNKAILFEMSSAVPGSRVLDGRWGAEHLAPAIPKGRMEGMPFLEAFTRRVRTQGTLEKAAQRAGLRGTVPASP